MKDKPDEVEGTAEKMSFWMRWGGCILAAVFAVVIPEVAFQPTFSGLNDAAVWMINLGCIFLFLASLVCFYRRRRPIPQGRLIETSLTFLIVFMAVIIFTPTSWVHQPNPNREKFACQDNLRVMDGAILQYEADHGEGVYPSTLKDLEPTYMRNTSWEPADGYYDMDTTTTPPHAACSKGHTY